MKIAAILLITAVIAFVASATDLTQIQFTRSDGSIYQTRTLAPYPETPTYLGQDSQYTGVNGIGTKTNSYGGAAYHIDVSKNELVLGDGFEVGVLLYNGSVVDVGTHYGVAIDNRGRMWLATVTNDGDNQYYLFRVDLSSAACTLIDVIDPGNVTFPINGLVYVPIQ